MKICATALAAISLLSVLSVRAERELTTDRPDATESPYTVEPKRVQIEASVVAYERDKRSPAGDDFEVTAWNVAPFNVRVGLTSRSEVQIVADSYLDVEVKDRTTGATERASGLGDVTLRAKWNVWGNDGGPNAFGVMPFVKLPTAQDDLGNGEVEGGLILPYAMELPGGWGFGAMTEVDIVRNNDDDGYAAAWVNTVTVGRDLGEKLGGFLELASVAGEGSHALSFNSGLTYGVHKDLQLDAGVSLGLSRAAPDLGVFIGFAQRF